ncbi:MAG TPA: asparagine synthase (glutamine-hydrolyzing), partial [Gemmataceae bacterium]|nr:asparagine synthase (glutamine-hydrolyzing) [Gemmataceae bacterium]
MCGIAGIIDLSGEYRPAPAGAIHAMADALVHRGPDEDGFLQRPGLAFASRRLSIVGLADGRQPIHNEDGSVSVVFNGELFDYPEMRAKLEGRGHRFATHCDTEVIPHCWEDHDEEFFPHLRGQFAFALWDGRKRRTILARDRFGICPLYWTRQGDWLLFASEIKGLLASGMVEAKPDPQGINHLFTFYALPGPATCFAGIQLLPPGHYLRIQLGAAGEAAQVSERVYWRMDFPDRGQEDYASSGRQLADRLEEVLVGAVTRRLRADVPVVSYLSGGVDSSMVVALATRVRGKPIPTFTIRIPRPDLDESARASLVARHIGVDPVVVTCGQEEVLRNYPALIRAAEGPVIDTSCASLLMLAREVHARGYKVALTGEGADEWLAGYPWHKLNWLLGWLDIIPGLSLSQLTRRLFVRLTGAPKFAWEFVRRAQKAVGGHNAWLDIYGLMSMSKPRFFSPWMMQLVADRSPYEDLGFDLERMRRWHPLNRELATGARVQLAGLLLNAKGDRVAMNSSVETRYPFLDEEVFDFLAQVPPRWKLRGLRDKALLRVVAERWLPRSIARRPKAMFRAPFDSFQLEKGPEYVGELLSIESLRRTGYFQPEAVEHWRKSFHSLCQGTPKRATIEMGLVGVLATQLWHHTFLDGSLADLPSLARSSNSYRPAANGHNGLEAVFLPARSVS